MHRVTEYHFATFNRVHGVSLIYQRSIFRKIAFLDEDFLFYLFILFYFIFFFFFVILYEAEPEQKVTVRFSFIDFSIVSYSPVSYFPASFLNFYILGEPGTRCTMMSVLDRSLGYI